MIDDGGEMVGVMSVQEALEIARDKKLDLVEMSPDARVPVCKLMDYGKFKFQMQKKESEAKKKQHQQALKEVQLRPNIGSGDLATKLKAVMKFLEAGDKVKIVIRFKGREVVSPDLGQKLIEKVKEVVGENGAFEAMPKVNPRQMAVMIAPQKRKPKS